MRGVYSNSGDPEKVAMLRLWEAKGNIDMIASAMVSQESHGDLTAEWAADKQEQTEKVKPILDVLGISLPETLEEARTLLGTIVNFENWAKLSEHYKKAENWLEDLNKEMVKDGDKHEKYSNEKLKGIEAEFISVAGEITVVLRKYNPSTDSEVSADQYEKKFTKDQRSEAETFFAELKNHLDVTAMEYDDEETSFKKADALFS